MITITAKPGHPECYTAREARHDIFIYDMQYQQQDLLTKLTRSYQ